MKSLSELTQERANSPNPLKDKNIEHEYQLLGSEMEEHFGKKERNAIWSHFYNPLYPLEVIRESWYSYQKQSIKSIKYYFGILNRKAGIKKKT